MRPRTLPAVSGLVVQIGSSTWCTMTDVNVADQQLPKTGSA